MSRILLQQAFISLRSAARGDGNYQDYSDVADALEAELAKPEQTETLRVADAIELNVALKTDRLFAAKELRRLHDENDTLKKCLFQMQNAAIELAKPEQSNYSDIVSNGGLDPRNKFDAPQRKEWVGLTGTEINHIFAANVGYPERMCRAIEAKLKKKNK